MTNMNCLHHAESVFFFFNIDLYVFVELSVNTIQYSSNGDGVVVPK